MLKANDIVVRRRKQILISACVNSTSPTHNILYLEWLAAVLYVLGEKFIWTFTIHNQVRHCENVMDYFLWGVQEYILLVSVETFFTNTTHAIAKIRSTRKPYIITIHFFTSSSYNFYYSNFFLCCNKVK